MEQKKTALVLGGIAGPAANDLKVVINDTLRDLDVELMSIEDSSPTATVTAGMTGAIQKADVIVADVTNGSPNVWYELGYAQALRKPTMLLLSTKAIGASIPSDLTGSHMIVYDPEDVSRVRPQIQRFLERQIVRLAY